MRKAIIILTLIDTAMIILLLTMWTRADFVTAPSGLRVREEPSTEAEVLEVLPYGTEIEGETEGEWIRLEDGYVSAEFVGEDPHAGMVYMGEWRITAYAETGSPCANGNYPTVGYTIACNSLPFGSEVYIDGVGFRTVEDRGPGWLGSEWCDLYLGDYGSCVTWGSQYRSVWLVN